MSCDNIFIALVLNRPSFLERLAGLPIDASPLQRCLLRCGYPAQRAKTKHESCKSYCS